MVEQRGGSGQRGHVLEAAVGEGRAIEALNRRVPVELAMQPVEVVAAGARAATLRTTSRRWKALRRTEPNAQDSEDASE